MERYWDSTPVGGEEISARASRAVNGPHFNTSTRAAAGDGDPKAS
jgi:hypothetical protein